MKIVRHVQGLDFLLYTTATFLSWSHSLLYIKKILKIYSKISVNVILGIWKTHVNTKIAMIEATIMYYCWIHKIVSGTCKKLCYPKKNHSNWGFAKSRSCCNNNQSCLHATYFSISSIHHKCEAMKHFAGIFLPLKTFLIIKKFIML